MNRYITSPHDITPKLIMLRNQPVLMDSDVAAIFGVDTKRITEAVKRNPDKFPDGYMFFLNTEEITELKSQIATLRGGKIAPRYEPFALVKRES